MTDLMVRGPSPGIGVDLIGRDDEQAAIAALLGEVREGLSGALVLRGEPGIGKSSLLEYASRQANDLTVLRVSGTESEMGLSYASLHRLLRAHLDGLHNLPSPQRLALEVVFGLEDGPPPSPFLVGLATLTLLTDTAVGRPVLCVIDDVQWLDHESIEVLTFVARRVLADGVALLFALRDTSNALGAIDGLATHTVTGLSDDASFQLLRSTVSTDLTYATANQIVAQTAGNPLAIVELASEITGLLGGGESEPLEPLPLTRRLEARFAQVARDLPADSQRYLLLAAVEPTGDARLLHAAAEALGLSSDAADEAETAGLLVTSPSVVFRHPLIRSAVYGTASAADRRRAHVALASVDCGNANVDMRAWHLGMGAAHPDEAVAAELEASAARVRHRSGFSTETSFLNRAAELSPDSSQAARRLIAAAMAAAAAGTIARGRSLLDVARRDAHDDLQCCLAQWLHGLFLIHEGHYADAPAVLLAAARAYRPFDVPRARSILLDALGAVCLAGDRAVGISPRDLAREALATPRPADATPTMADLLLDGTATRLAVGYADAAPTLRAALQSSVTDEAPTANIALWSMLGTYAALELLDDIALQSWVSAIELHARDSGSITLLRGVLLDLGTAASLAGRFDDAASFNNELRQLNLISDAPAHMDALIDVELLGLQGRDAEGRAAARILQQAAVAMGFQAAHNRGLLACVRLDLAAGNYTDALVAGNELADNPALGIGCIVLPDIVEAGARSGDIAAATHALDRFTERTQVSGTPWALGLLARCRAVLAPVSDAKEQYEESLQQLGKTSMTFDLARTHLVYGEWLRRERQRIDARDQLRAAMDAFVSMGADGFAERARSELIATGERARRRTVDTARDLTPQERQIAEMAAHRDTNREIATRLFISASTVDYHLRSVYRKLGVNSRRHLEQALEGEWNVASRLRAPQDATPTGPRDREWTPARR